MLDESPEGMLIDAILAAMAEFYSRDLGRKTSKGLHQKAQEGGWPGWAPLGYLNVKDPQTGRQTIEIDQSRAYFITEAFKRFKTGKYTVQSLIDELYQEGFRSRTGKKIHKSVMTNLLRNIFYTGKMRYKGKIYQGKHKPLIDMETYSEVQKILDAHNQGANRTRKHKFLLRGLLYCKECGSLMTAERHVKKSGLVFDYYRCLGPKQRGKSCSQGFVPVKAIEEDLKRWLQSIKISEKFLKALRLALEEIAQANRDMNKQKIRALENRKVGIERKMSRLEDMLLEEKIAEKRFSEKYLSLRLELKQVEMQIAQAKNPRARLLYKDIDEIVAFVQSFDQVYLSFNRVRKRQFLEALISKIWIKDKKIVDIEYSDSWQMILDKDLVRISSNWLAIRDLIRTLINQHKEDIS